MSQDPIQKVIAQVIPEWVGLCDDEPMRLAAALTPYVYQFAAEMVREAAADLDANTAHRCDNSDLIYELGDFLGQRARLAYLSSAR